jgi:PmbA protein
VIATSTGIHAVDRVTDAYMKVMCRSADARTGQASQAAIAAADLDPGAIARAAAAKVVGGEPVRLPPGEYPVVLDAEAVGGLLEMLGALAFNGLAHAEGRGALDGRLGRQVAADIITIADTTNNSRTWPRAFDFEGVPKAPITLIDQGIARHVVHDTRSAAVAGAGARSTGHAIAPGGSASGPYATNLILAPGDAPDVAALAAPIERGLYVTRLWYLNVVHPKQTLLTGTTRDGTFLVEDGKITRPARDVRLTDSVLRILSATEQLTATPRLTTDAEYYGRRFATGAVCPALRAGGFRVTG